MKCPLPLLSKGKFVDCDTQCAMFDSDKNICGLLSYIQTYKNMQVATSHLTSAMEHLEKIEEEWAKGDED